MPIKSSTVKYLSNPVINVPRNRHPSVFFTVVSEKKKKVETRNIMAPSYHEKVSSTQKQGFQFFSCFGHEV